MRAAVADQAAPSPSRPSALAWAHSEISSVGGRRRRRRPLATRSARGPARRDSRRGRAPCCRPPARRVWGDRSARGIPHRSSRARACAAARPGGEDRLELALLARGAHRRAQPPKPATPFHRPSIFVAVREGDEHGFELRRRDIHALLEQRRKSAAQRSASSAKSVAIAPTSERQPAVRREVGPAGLHGARAPRTPSRREAGGERRGPPRSRAGFPRACCLVDLARRRQLLHHVGPAPKAASGMATADDLPEIVGSRSPKRSWAPPRARRNLVITSSKTSSAPLASQSLGEALQEAGRRRMTPSSRPPVRRLRTRGLAVPRRAAGRGIQVVVRADDRVRWSPWPARPPTRGSRGGEAGAASASSASAWPW